MPPPALLALALTAWPATSELTLHPLPASPKRLRVVIDAGHGAPDNHGNHGCFGQAEEDHTLAVSQYLAFTLSALGRFDVFLTRKPGTTPRYHDRIAQAEAWAPDVIISLHSDARGDVQAWWPDAGTEVQYRNPDAPGFAVLWSDRCTAQVCQAKERLGRIVGRSLRESGFLAYSGVDYGALYRQDPVEPSGWVDVRPLPQSVYFLRASAIPTVIIETHHALDPVEVERWAQLNTLDAFAYALASALLEFKN